MVGDDHQVAHAERGVDASRSVRDKEVADAQQLHHPHGEGHLLHAVALVVVEAALHGHHAMTLDQAENKPSLVALDRRDGEIGNVVVVDGVFRLNLVGEIAQTGSENDAHFGAERLGRLLQEGCRLFNFL